MLPVGRPEAVRVALVRVQRVTSFRALLPRLGRTPSWMKTLDQPALFLSVMEVVID